MLEDILTDQEQSQGAANPRMRQPEQKGTLTSIVQGLGGGVAKGLAQPGAAITRPIFGEHATDSALNNLDNIFKADNLNPAGEFTYGTSTMIGGVIGSSMITLGAGGSYGAAAAYGITSASAEKADLKKRGLSTEDAWKGGAVKGVTDAISVGLPTGGLVRNKLADAILSVGGATAVGAGGQYIEGSFIEGVATDEKTKEYGRSLMESAFDAQSLAADSSFGLLLWGLNAYSRARTDSQARLVADTTDAANVDVNMEVLEKSNPLTPATPKDASSHLDKLDEVMASFKNDQPTVNSQSRVTGEVKYPPVIGALPTTVASRAKNEFKFSEDQIPYVLATVDFESNFNPSAFNKSSKAEGLFQVIPSTWQHRKGGNIKNIDEQIRVGLKNMKADIDDTEKAIGRKLVGSEVYLPQLLGSGGARTILRADPNEDFFPVAVRMYSKSKNPEAVARKMMKDNGIRKGMTVAQVKQKFLSKIEDRAKKFGGDAEYSQVYNNGPLRGSDSNFPEYEVQGVQVPEYKSAATMEADVMPNMVTPQTDPFAIELKSEEFRAIEELPTKQDFELMQKVTGYQPVNGAANNVNYTPQQVDLQGVEIGQRTIADLDNTMVRQQTDIESDPTIRASEQQPVELETEQLDLSDWNATRSQNYVKREMVDNNVRVQELYNKDTGVRFSREIGKDGKPTAIKITKGNRDISKSDNGSVEQTEMQAAATKAIESEFQSIDEAPSAKSFESTPDGREASRMIDENPDMEVTFTPTTIDGLEFEPVTMKASDLKQFIKDQYEEAASNIEAVRVAASCAIKFGV